jgi:hypothetical protein
VWVIIARATQTHPLSAGAGQLLSETANANRAENPCGLFQTVSELVDEHGSLRLWACRRVPLESLTIPLFSSFAAGDSRRFFRTTSYFPHRARCWNAGRCVPSGMVHHHDFDRQGSLGRRRRPRAAPRVDPRIYAVAAGTTALDSISAHFDSCHRELIAANVTLSHRLSARSAPHPSIQSVLSATRQVST